MGYWMGFHKWGSRKAGWFIRENPIKLNDWGYPHFRKPPNRYDIVQQHDMVWFQCRNQRRKRCAFCPKSRGIWASNFGEVAKMAEFCGFSRQQIRWFRVQSYISPSKDPHLWPELRGEKTIGEAFAKEWPCCLTRREWGNDPHPRSINKIIPFLPYQALVVGDEIHPPNTSTQWHDGICVIQRWLQHSSQHLVRVVAQWPLNDGGTLMAENISCFKLEQDSCGVQTITMMLAKIYI